MVANKRGPVELQMLEMARLTPSVFVFPTEASAWFSERMSEAGGRVVVAEGDWEMATQEIVAAFRPSICHFHFGPHIHIAHPLTVQTEHSFRHRRRGALARALVRRWRTRRVAHFIAVSRYIAQQTRRDFLHPSVCVIYNGTDLTLFRPRTPDERKRLKISVLGIDGHRRVVTMAAHFHHHKRHRDLLRAWQAMPAHDVLVLAGGGPEEAALREQAAGMDNVLILTGENDVASLYGASDLAVFLTDGEGLGGSGIEALASGLPLLVTPTGGAAEIGIDGESCVHITAPENVDGLSRVLRTLLQDQASRERIGNAARLRAQVLFDVRRAAYQTNLLYRELQR
jgi:glycosyltransferase involved in cell wall biosynthesis